MAREGKDSLGYQNLGGLRIGRGVRMQGVRPELLLALIVVFDLCNATDVIAVITSLLDGQHMRNSLHYTGAAVDFDMDLTADWEPWVTELRSRLGPEYDVINEGDHIHIEHQPHTGAGN